MGKYLGIDIYTGEPAPEGGVGVIPANHNFSPLSLFKHVQHVLLVNRID